MTCILYFYLDKILPLHFLTGDINTSRKASLYLLIDTQFCLNIFGFICYYKLRCLKTLPKNPLKENFILESKETLII